MKQQWTLPPRTLEIKQGMLDAWSMLLLSEDAAACVQIETPAGYLIRVLPIEQDFGDQPDELKDFITEARRLRKDWLLVPMTTAREPFSLMQ